MSYLELRNLEKSFDGINAVRDFNLEVKKGEFISLLGPSGCGKTTTLRMVAGFELPDFGSIVVDGEDITMVPSNQRGMGMVFQSYALFPNMTAWDNIAFGLRVARQPAAEIQDRVARILDLVGLSESGSKYSNELSGGQQQRVALARALAIEPRVLLLDEPLSALDAVVRVSLRSEIRRIQSTLGITTIYVTHDQEEALSISDRVVVMRKAVIEQVGTPEEIYIQPDTHFVATFVGTVNEFFAVLKDAGSGLAVGSSNTVIHTNPVSGTFRNGDQVVVYVRPEEIHVSTKGLAVHADNQFTAVVREITLLGPVTRLILEMNGFLVTADIKTVDRNRYVINEPVSISFNRSACRVMPAG
ncbi:MAG: ABC transporter ATP-binding protein [Anaerolineales bacterium]|nr:ABC transporter ATP-binding protein [Anaerolineales bacterium]